MKKQIMNPYLPLWEYIPDGEPRIFDNRLYIYGSHDEAGGEKGYCPGDYMSWSAPLEDLSDWQCHGVLYSRSQSPDLSETDAMAAPDVVKGPDGRYYLYYNTNAQMICRVAVSDRAQGPFTYYGDVSSPDGTPYTEYKMFDPGVLVDDDGRVYLYTGFCMSGPVPEEYKGLKSPFAETSIGFELAPDMKTIIAGPVPIIPGGNVTGGTGFEGHGFYEASSPRKIRGTYVMVYSAETSHEMAYAISDAPLGPYRFMGALVSSADLGYEGNTEPVMPYGNVHGGLVQLHGDWYILYHRQTHGIECCRQGCAEKLPIREDGWFGMAEVTSCGLNRGPLRDEGTIMAAYCCHLSGPAVSRNKMSMREGRRLHEPQIIEEINASDESLSQVYVTNIQPDTVVGYKYFDFRKPSAIALKLRGSAGHVTILARSRQEGAQQDLHVLGYASFEASDEWQTVSVRTDAITGENALYFSFDAAKVDFQSFDFIH